MSAIFGKLSLFFTVLLIPISALTQVLELNDLSENLSYFPEAKRFEAKYEDLTLQGIEVGPEDGVPLVFTGGFTSNLPLYRKVIRELASRGFRVFNYNPPGQGAGTLVSGGQDPAWNSFGGMTEAQELMVRTVYTLTGSKVVLVGHSMGGMTAKMFSLGLDGLRTDQLKVNPAKQKEVLDHTLALVPLFSPSLTDMSIRNQGLPFSRLIERIAEFALRKAMPWSMETFNKFMRSVPETAGRYFKFLEALYVAPFDPWNEFWIKVLRGRSLDLAEMREVGPFGMSETIYPEIIDSLQNWNEREGSISLNGFNIGEAWLQKQNTELAIPTLLGIAKKDKLAPEAELLRESQRANLKSMLFKGGHVDPLFDNEQVPSLVDKIIEFIELEKCDSLFGT